MHEMRSLSPCYKGVAYEEVVDALAGGDISRYAQASQMKVSAATIKMCIKQKENFSLWFMEQQLKDKK